MQYREVEDSYFEQRGLRRHARIWSLWALGVGAVISGDFFGWNYGLAAGGFGGMLIATALITVMYVGLCFSIAEMSPALPHTGGAYSFARTALGPWGGFITGLAENLEFVLTPAVIVVGIGGYLGQVFGTPPELAPLWWLAAYVVFIGLNIAGAEISFRFTVVITICALVILAVFWVGAIPHVDFMTHAVSEGPDGAPTFLPHGWTGFFGCLPFAVWFFLAIEELPLAAEEAHDPKRDMPRGIAYGLVTLVIAAFLTLTLSSGIPPGADGLGQSDEPLFEGFRTIFGEGLGTRLLALIATLGLIASFHTIVFAYGRQIYSLSRAGYFPPFLSYTHPKRKTPHVALLVGGALGYLVALGTYFLETEGRPVGAIILNMAVFGAMLSYMLQTASFIALRLRFPALERPYRSPFGIPGAALAFAIAVVALVALFVSDPTYRIAVLGAAGWYAAGLAYFGFYARHRLVYAPEEAFAVGKSR